jgi:O-antigen/teichoic acid export membrane protein
MSSRFAHNTFFHSVAGLSYALGAFIVSIIVARALGVQGAGVFALATWIVMITVTLTDFGIGSALMRYLPELTASRRGEDAERLASYLFMIFACSSTGAFSIYVVLGVWSARDEASDLIRAIDGQPELWIVIGGMCFAQSFATFTTSYWRGMQKYDRVAMVTVLSTVAQISGIVIGAFWFGIAGALIGFIFGALIPALASVSIVKSGREFPAELHRRVLRYAAYCWAGALASSLIWSRVEVAFLSSYFGSRDAGLFSVGATLAAMATQGPMLLTGGLLPYFAENIGAQNHEAIREGMATGTRLIAFMVLPMCLGTAAITPELLPMIYGAEFEVAVPAATLLVASAALGACGLVATQVVFANERSDFVLLCNLGGVVAAMFVGFFIIPSFGLMGAAWGRVAVQLLMVLAGFWFVEFRLGYPVPFNHLARLLLAASLCAGVAHACITLVPGLLGMVLAIVLGAAIYFVSVRLLRALPESDVERLRILTRHLPDFLRRPLDVAWRKIETL